MQENIQRHLRGFWLEMSPQRKMPVGKKHLFWNRTELGVKPPHTHRVLGVDQCASYTTSLSLAPLTCTRGY